MRPLTAIAIVLAISLPWYLAVHFQTDGAFTRGFFLEHNLGRATTPMERHGGPPILYYLLVTFAAFFPWSVFLVVMFVELAIRIAGGDPWRRGYVLLACWVGVYIGLFSLAQTKLPSYVTPMYPALGLIAGAYLRHLMRGTLRSGVITSRMALGALTFGGAVIAIGLYAAAPRVMPGAQWLAALGGFAIVGGVVSVALSMRGKQVAAILIFAVAATATTVSLLGLALDYVDEHYQKSHLLLAAAQRHAPAASEPKLHSYGVLEPSWVFYAGQAIEELEAPRDRSELIARLSKSGAFAITLITHYEHLKTNLPADVEVLERVPYFLRPDKPDLVLIGRPSKRADQSAR